VGHKCRVHEIGDRRGHAIAMDFHGGFHRMTSRIPKLTATAAAAGLALAAWWLPASAQDTSPLHATIPPAALGVREAQTDNSLPAEAESSFPQTVRDDPDSDPICARPGCANCSLLRSPAFSETSPNPPEEKPEKKRPMSYGLEIGLRSGHADRGFVISDRPVVQSEAWVSGSVVSFSVWSNLTLAETGDGSRPQILEMELTSEHQWHQWRNLTIKPALRMFSYHDPLNSSSSRSRSIEGWLYLSYDAGPFRLFTNHSFDALTYRGAYFGEAGIEFERGGSQTKVGGSFSTGWASATFNDAYADFDKSALNRISLEGWLKRYVKPHLYIGPQFEFSNLVDRALRAKLPQPTFFFVGLTTGVEF
jgi:hypothetical protein